MLRCVGLIHNQDDAARALRARGAIVATGGAGKPSSSGEVVMLSRKHCPHTGIVNFFADAEPFLAVGSVVKATEPGSYYWRCYVGQQPVAGSAPDMRAAESRLVSHYRELEQATRLTGADAADAAAA
jgi:hypothetical protein